MNKINIFLLRKFLFLAICSIVLVWCSPLKTMPTVTTIFTHTPPTPVATAILQPTLTLTIELSATQTSIPTVPALKTPTPEIQELIAFVGESEDDPRTRSIFVMRANGTDPVNLTNASGWWDESPSWSPDGTKIAFRSGRDGDTHQLYVMNADGSGVMRLTDQMIVYGKPSWDPNGNQIAFEARGEGDNWDIFVIDLVTLTVTNWTKNPASDKDPSWSPDGAKIAFVSDRDGPPFENYEIYVMDTSTQGESILRLTNSPLSETHPDWSPDGSKIAYTLYTSRAPVICVMDANGSNQVQLLEEGFDTGGSNPSWSRDGTWIVFQDLRNLLYGQGKVDSGDFYAIYRLSADGTNIKRLTSPPLHASEPDWQP